MEWLNQYTSSEKYIKQRENSNKQYGSKILQTCSDDASSKTSRRGSNVSERLRDTLGVVGPTYFLNGGVLFVNNPFENSQISLNSRFKRLLHSGIYQDLMMDDSFTIEDICAAAKSDLDLLPLKDRAKIIIHEDLKSIQVKGKHS